MEVILSRLCLVESRFCALGDLGMDCILSALGVGLLVSTPG